MEHMLLLIFGSWLLLFVALSVAIVWIATSQLLLCILIGTFIVIPLGYFTKVQYNQLNGFYKGMLGHLDAIISDDYRCSARRRFGVGMGSDISDKLSNISGMLHLANTRYDQTKLMVYDLLDVLDVPMLLLNEKSQLIRANNAFSGFSQAAWQLQIKGQVNRFGLQKDAGIWKFVDHDRNHRWRIQHSVLDHDGIAHELLVFIDQQSTIRKTRQEAWQKLIRVLKHEIGNSLTPIQALSMSIAEHEPLSPKGKEILRIIHDRAVGLQSFIDAYVESSKTPEPKFEYIHSRDIYNRIRPLFVEQPIEFYGEDEMLFVDPHLLEQILINLLKNAFEASKPGQPVVLNCITKANQVYIEVIDNGCGIQNLDNIQTPFYSTKENGQGLGLELCRVLVESQGGELNLKNRKNQSGAVARINFPLPSCT